MDTLHQVRIGSDSNTILIFTGREFDGKEKEILFIGKIFKTFYFKTIDETNQFLENNPDYGLLVENTVDKPFMYFEKPGFYCAKLKDKGV